MSVSVTIDGTEVNGSDGRRLHGQISDVRTSQGIREVVISGLITGSSVTDLQDKWETAKNLCNTRDKECRVKVDDSATNYLEEFYLADGKTTGIVSFISGDPTRVGTETSMPVLLTIVAQEYVAQPPGTVGTTEKFEGQIDDWQLMKILSTARVEQRVFTIRFGSDHDADANGPFTFSSVEDNGSGKARFVFGTGDLSGLSLEAGMRLHVTGTSGEYAGSHEVTAIDTGTDKITVDFAYGSTDSGTATLGESTDAEAVYAASKASILSDILEVGANGKRDSTTGLALTNETKNIDGDIIEVVLEAMWIEADYDDDIRDVNIAIERVDTVEWPDDGEAGSAPVSLAAVVTFVVDKDQAANDNPYPMWATIRASVLADIRSNADLAGAIGPINEKVGFDKKSGTVSVSMGFIAENTDIFSYARTQITKSTYDFMSWKDAEGYDYVQRGKEPIQKLISITVKVASTSNTAPNIDVPQEPGYSYVELDVDYAEDQPMIKPEIGTIYTRSLTKVFRRFKFRNPSDGARVRSPVTGR